MVVAFVGDGVLAGVHVPGPSHDCPLCSYLFQFCPLIPNPTPSPAAFNTESLLPPGLVAAVSHFVPVKGQALDTPPMSKCMADTLSEA